MTDGDTLILNSITYRLWGTDAPETKQDCPDGWPAGRMATTRLLQGAAGVFGAEGSQPTPAVATIDGRKKFEKTRDASDELLPDDFILTCVYPKTKDEKFEVDKLGAIVDSMDRLRVNEETPVSEDTETVLQTAIDALIAA